MRRRFVPTDKLRVPPRVEKSAKSPKRESASLPPITERWSEENREKLAERIFGRPPPQLFTSIFCSFQRRFVPERRAFNIFLSGLFVTNRRKSAPPRLPTRIVNRTIAKAPVSAFIDDLRMGIAFIYAIFLCFPGIVFIGCMVKCAINGLHLVSQLLG